ncbi:hypothetical protein SB717_35620, partial [Priestia sp. SIMBA_032]|uniref:hypothetical protein n=1 Tax=Priestia sp. SIMBA_032 TaxID=3085775 RepID=UPI00397D5338
EMAERTATGELPAHPDLGRYVARIAGLHQMSAAVAGALERHEPADTAAAVVKVLGTATEGDIADFADLLGTDGTSADYAEMIADAVAGRP